MGKCEFEKNMLKPSSQMILISLKVTALWKVQAKGNVD